MKNLSSKACFALSIAAGTWAFGAQVEAQSTGELPADTTSPSSRIALDVGFYTHQQTEGLFGTSSGFTLVLPSFDANVHVLAIDQDMSLSVDVAFRSVAFNAWANVGDDQLYFRAANLYAGVRLALTPLEGLRLRFGAGLVAPIANAYNGGTSPDAALLILPLYSVAPNGAWDSWMSWRGDVPLVLRADGEYRSGMFFAGAETALGLGVPVLDGYDEVSIGLQLGVWGGVRPIPELALGARLQAVLMHPGEANAALGFASLAPFVRGEFGRAFVETRLFVSLADNDLYGRIIGEKSWGLYALFGLQF